MITQTDLELLNAYLDDALLPDERRILDSRIAADPALRAELESLRATRDLIRALPVPPLPRSFTLTREQAARESGVTLVRRAIPYIAAAAAAVTLAFGVLSLGGDETTQGTPAQVADLPTRGAVTGASASESTQETGVFSAMVPLATPTQATTFSGGVPTTLATATQTMILVDQVPGDAAGMIAQETMGGETFATEPDPLFQDAPGAPATPTIAPALQDGLADSAMAAPMTSIGDDSASTEAAEIAPTELADLMMREMSPTGEPEIAPAAAYAIPMTAMPSAAPTASPLPSPRPPAPTPAPKLDGFAALVEALRALLVRLFTAP